MLGNMEKRNMPGEYDAPYIRVAKLQNSSKCCVASVDTSMKLDVVKDNPTYDTWVITQ